MCNNLLHYTKCVKIYPITKNTRVNIVYILCKYLPTSCTGKYLHNVMGVGKYCVNIFFPIQQCTGWKYPFIDLVEFCNTSQQEWHFEAFTLIHRKLGIVVIYAVFCVKFWSQKRWSCKIFDKYHVWDWVTDH